MEAITPKTILITGGAGFIGSHLCRKYVTAGHKVICVDNLQTTNSTDTISDLLLRRNFTFIKHDIIKPIPVREHIDWIFNLACAGSYTSYQFDPVHTVKTNTVGMLNALDLARVNNARIMQFSTSEIYGDPLESPQREEYRGNVNTLGPRACYDEGKRVAETLCMDYHREYGVDAKIIRIFNTYGPSQDPNDGRVVTNFILKALSNENLIVYGDGGQTRSFQYIDDLIEAVDRMMRKDNFQGPVNLGNPGEITMKELAEKVIKLTRTKSKLEFTDQATDDPKRRCPDITLAKKELGWEPKVALEEGLKKTIEYFKAVKLPERKILVVATTYYPEIGPAEQALHELTQAMPGTEFHIITTKLAKDRQAIEQMGNVTIYRIGLGTKQDKYLLPALGLKQALKLYQEHEYRFVWSVMASYAAMVAWGLKTIHRDINFLMTFDGSEVATKTSFKKKFLLPLSKRLLRKADSVYLSDVTQEQQSSVFTEDTETSVISKESTSFVNQVRYTYANLLNKQQKKLARPK